MPEFTLAERMRTAHVNRWQIVRTARQQTLAEHLYLVRVLTVAFCRAAHLSEVETQLAEQWALEHDVPEVKTGDINTPIKDAVRRAVPEGDPIKTIELSMSSSYADLYNRVKTDWPHLRQIVKLADIVEAISFITIEGLGAHAREAERGLRADYVKLYGTLVSSNDRYTHIWPAINEVVKQYLDNLE